VELMVMVLILPGSDEFAKVTGFNLTEFWIGTPVGPPFCLK